MKLLTLLRQRWLMVVALLALVAIAAYTLNQRGTEVEVVPVKEGPIRQSLAFSARVASVARTDLASTLTARVVSVHVREGDRVKAGDLLISFETPELSAQLSQAEAALASAEARLRGLVELSEPVARQAVVAAESAATLARRELDRQRALAARGFIGEARVQEAERADVAARAALDQARAQQRANLPAGAEGQIAATRLAEARANVQLAKARLAQTQLRAPAAGEVISRTVEPGIVAQPGRSLITLALDGETRLIAQIDEKNVRFLREGLTARAGADAYPQAPFNATLTYLAPAVDAARGTLEARLRVNQPPAFLRDDMTVAVEIITAEQPKALLVPSVAVRDVNGQAIVMVINEGRIAPQNVGVGIRSPQWVEIVKGLALDTPVVITPAVTPGQRVRPIPVQSKLPRSDFEPPGLGR
jgi:HlyD family secretion protein